MREAYTMISELERYYIIILALMFGCSNNQNIKREYYSNNQIKSEVLIKNGKENGLKTNYYENGIVRSLVNMKDGLRNGSSFYYSFAGWLESIGHFRNDTEEGDFTYFDKLNKIDTIVGYNKGIVRKYLVFDTMGNIINASPFITINAEQDTIKSGEIYIARIHVNFPLKGYDCNVYIKSGGKSKDEIYKQLGEGTEVMYSDTSRAIGEHIYKLSVLQIDHSKLNDKGKGYNADFKIMIEKKYWVK